MLLFIYTGALGQNSDSNTDYLQKLDPQSRTIIEWLAIGSDSLNAKNFRAAKNIFETALKLDHPSVDEKTMAQIYNNLGIAKYSLGLNESSAESYSLAIEYYDRVHDQASSAQSSYNLGLSYKKIGAFLKADSLLMIALAYYEGNRGQTKADDYLSRGYNTVGNIERDLGNLELSLEFHEKALALRTLLGDSAQIASSLHNIGQTYREQGKLGPAEQFFRRALLIKHQLGLDKKTASSLAQLGEVNILKGDIDSAISYLELALVQRRQYGDHTEIASNLNRLSLAYLKHENVNQADIHLTEAWILASDSKANNILFEIAEVRVLWAQITQDSEAGVLWYETLLESQEQVFAKEKKDAMSRLQVEYDVRRTKREFTLKEDHYRESLGFEEERNELVNTRLKTSLIIGSLLLLALIALARFFYLNKIKNSIIASNNTSLLARNKEVELLHKELAHRTNNQYSTLQRMFSMHSGLAKTAESKELLKDYQRRLEALSFIHKFFDKETDVFDAKIQFDEYMDALVGHLSLAYEDPTKTFEIQKSFPPVLLSYKNAMSISLIVNEIVTNAYKYAVPKTEDPMVEVEYTVENEKMLKLSIMDNGPGLDKDRAKIESGLGLELVQKLVTQLDGNMFIEEGEGVKFSISFAIS
jgi:two-component sensor histidine kinase/tetratricopeptide (TPR) repeat protein